MSVSLSNDNPEEFRAGFVSFVGRPNVGKSTLTNALVGEKVAITSSKPQTTRRAIRGIAHYANGQLILVDTPGMHRPRTLLGERLNSIVQTTLGDLELNAQELLKQEWQKSKEEAVAGRGQPLPSEKSDA